MQHWLVAVRLQLLRHYPVPWGRWGLCRPKQSVDSTRKIQPLNLQNPFQINRRFDLVMTLEVAEHLPDTAAANFVESLTQLGPVILFSAAVPFQGGTGHVNEKWPDYWANLFSKHAYVPIDCIREKVWNNPDVQIWGSSWNRVGEFQGRT